MTREGSFTNCQTRTVARERVENIVNIRVVSVVLCSALNEISTHTVGLQGKGKGILHLYGATSRIAQLQQHFLCHRPSGRTAYRP